MLKNRKKLTFVLSIAFVLGLTVILAQFPLYYLESLLYDARFLLKPQTAPSNKIVTVALDKKSLEIYKRAPNAKEHTQLLQAISEDKPKLIISSFKPTTTTFKGDKNSFSMVFFKTSPKELSEFKSAVQSIGNVAIIMQELFSQKNIAQANIPEELSGLNVRSVPISKDEANFAQDNVSRRTLIEFENEPLFFTELALKENGLTSVDQVRGVFNFRTSRQIMTDIRKAGTYKALSFADVADRRFPKGAFTDKIVILGVDTLAEIEDYVRTPYSRDAIAMSKLEFMANMLDTLIQNHAFKKTNENINNIFTILISLLTMFAVFSLTPIQGMIFVFTSALMFTAVSVVSFSYFGLWIEMAHPLLSIFICYYFFIPYRLIRENRKSWEYQQKNRLLKQVDEMKSNFLNMMSHDLKTPLARIQGMVDVALQDKAKLNETQLRALKTINQSTEELGVFISSVLNLSRIESKEVKLHLESRDVNQIIKEVIQKYRFIANERGIEIVDELEPLFSIKMDPDLIRQVLSNLVENAIKYSPDNTKILVTTEEIDGKISIQVSDQGKGITKADQANVFQKFYRTSDAKDSTIKGSGLGLYLAKYFVELHHGKISVDSEPQQGSTFTVQLPMDQ